MAKLSRATREYAELVELQLADILTKAMESEAFTKLMKDSRWCLLPTEDEQQHEDHLVALRRAQRERRKAKMKGNP